MRAEGGWNRLLRTIHFLVFSELDGLRRESGKDFLQGDRDLGGGVDRCKIRFQIARKRLAKYFGRDDHAAMRELRLDQAQRQRDFGLQFRSESGLKGARVGREIGENG